MSGLVNPTNATQVRNIRVRTYDGRWIPIPMGAGEDANLKSLSVHDGTQWQTATWAKHTFEWVNAPLNFPGVSLWTYTPFDANYPKTITSLEVRAPGLVTHQMADLNPNYISHAAQAFLPWVPLRPNYFRVMHTAPKVDPKWRIIQLWDLHPLKPPSTTQWDGFATPFWAFGAVHQRMQVIYGDGRSTDDTDSFAIPGQTYPQVVGSNREPESMGSWSYIWSGINTDGTQPYVVSSQIISTTTVDLKTIRQRLVDDYPQRNIDWQGQYDPITSQTVKRVLVSGTAFLQISYSALHGNISWFDLPRLRIYVAKNVSTTAVAPYNPDFGTSGYTTKKYAPRYADSLAPQGDLVYDHTGFDPGERPTTFSLDTDGVHEAVGAAHQHQLELVLDDIDDNDTLTFYCVVDSYKQSDTNTHAININAGLIINQTDSVSVQYASSGHDVPSEKQHGSIRG